MRVTSTRARRMVAIAGAAALTLSVAACAQSQRSNSSSSGTKSGGTFVFGASSDPVALDPAFASDGETFRVARQIFEGLVSTKKGTADPAPGLATSWKGTSDGLSYTFQLRKGVKFSDGTPFNAEAVCANFDRWYNFTGILQSQNLSYYWGSLFRGFKHNESKDLQPSVYKDCKADSTYQATIDLTSPFAAFVQAMSLPAFSMQSPTAMQKYHADQVGGTDTDPRFSEYATAHPTGTGPFLFDKWDRGQQVVLKRNPNYWGEKAKLDKVIIKTISDGKARLQALESGDIDGYDLVAPGDLDGLKSAGYTIAQRPAFNILYLGINQKVKPLDDIRVRQAIAYAIDKNAVIKQSLPPGTKVADEFIPDLVAGYAKDVTKYDYNPDKAKQLLAEAGATNLTIQFNYPTGVSRPYMPSPEDTFVAIKSQLEKVGIKITPAPDKWSPDYLDKIQGGSNHGIHLLGWTGDYNDTDNFVGVFFGKQSNEWGFDNPKLFSDLDKARGLATRAEQVPAYEAINKEVMDFLPGIPLAHPTPSLAFNKKVKGYETSPVQDEVWNTVTVG